MKLRRLRVRRLPGISEPFEWVLGNAPLQIVLGPNGSGKTACCRAIRQLMWPEREPPATSWIETEWSDANGRTWTGRLDGTTNWECEGRPATPPLPAADTASGYHFPLSTLFDAQAHDYRFARDCLRRMAGGYDLPAWRASLEKPSKHARRQAVNRLRNARRHWKSLLDHQRSLSERADTYAAIEAERDGAIQAESDVRHVDKALAYHGHKADLTVLEARAPSFPPGMDRLSPDRLETLDEIDRRIQTLTRDIAKTRSLAETVHARAAEAALPAETLPEAAFQSMRQCLDRARNRHEIAAAAQRRRAALSAQWQPLARTLGVAPDALAVSNPDPDTLATIDPLLQTVRRAIHETKTLRADLQTAVEVAERAAPEELPRSLRASAALETWLHLSSTPPAPRRHDRHGNAFRLAREGLSALAGLAFLGLGFARTDPLLVLGGVWLLGLAALIWREHSTTTDRALSPEVKGSPQRAQNDFEALQIQPAPKVWTADAVSHCLAAYQIDIERRKQAADARERLQLMRPRLEQAERMLADAQAELARALTQAGFLLPAAPGDEESLSLLSDTLRQWRNQQREDHTLKAEIHAAQQQAEEACRTVNRKMAGLLKAPADADVDPDTLQAAIDSLERRWRQRDQDRREAAQIRTQLLHMNAERERLLKDRNRLLSHSAIDPETGNAREQLAERCARLSEYQQWVQETRRLRETLVETENSLQDQSEWLSLDPGALRIKRESLMAQAARRDALTRTLQQIEDETRHASERNAFEAAETECMDAEANLQRLADRAIEAAIAEQFTEHVIATYTADARPTVLEQADRLLGRFTRGRYRLQVTESDSEKGELSAFDVHHQCGAALETLSDATRLQLLVAARLAAVLQQESGSTFPVFFDETLTNSDPERFKAVLLSMLDLSGERQVIYLTSDPADVARIRQICESASVPPPDVIDLASARSRPPSSATTVFVPQPDPPPPGPGEHPANYAERIRVLPPSRFLPWTALDLFFLLEDQLDTLHRLRVAGIETAGQAATLLETGALDGLLAPETRQRLDCRLKLTRAVHGEACRGIGRPVDREALAATGAVSDRFLNALTELARDLDGHAESLISALQTRRDARSQGFQSRKIEDLENALREGGWIDERPPGNERTALAAALTATQHLPDDRERLADCRRLTQRLWQCWTAAG